MGTNELGPLIAATDKAVAVTGGPLLFAQREMEAMSVGIIRWFLLGGCMGKGQEVSI